MRSPKKVLAPCGSLPAPVQRLHDAIAGCDAVLIASLRKTLTTMSAPLLTDACLALPLRSTGITGQGILDSEHAAAIRRALVLLTGAMPA